MSLYRIARTAQRDLDRSGQCAWGVRALVQAQAGFVGETVGSAAVDFAVSEQAVLPRGFTSARTLNVIADAL